MRNTLSCVGGPTLNLESLLLQLFQIHSPGVLGTSAVMMLFWTPSRQKAIFPGTQSTRYSCRAVYVSEGAGEVVASSVVGTWFV